MATITLYKCDWCGLLYQDVVITFGSSDLGGFYMTCQACMPRYTIADLAKRSGWVPQDPPPVPVKIV